MLMSVNIFSDVAVYIQIENEIRYAISSGKLKAGDKLPSVREIAERLKINPNTVNKAFRDLEIMGLVYSRRGMGVFVGDGVLGKCREDCLRGIISRLHEVTQEAKAAGIPKKLLTDAIAKSFASKAGLYNEVPKAVLDLAKG